MVVDRAAVTIQPHVNLAGDARDTVVFERAAARSGRGVDSDELFMRGALTRIALMAGALDRVYEIAVRHASDRRQFGRPIGSFQAVQQHLVNIAQQVALAGVAAEATARRAAGFEIAAGKLLANRAALSGRARGPPGAGRAGHDARASAGTAHVPAVGVALGVR